MGSLIKIGKVYYGKYKELDGELVRKTTKQRHPQKAAAILAEWERRVAQGLWGQVDAEEKRAAAEQRTRRDTAMRLTVAALCDEFLAHYSRPRIKRLDRYRRAYGSYIRRGIKDSPLSSMLAASVRRVDIVRWRDEYLRARYAPGTINTILGLCHSMWNWAIDTERLAVSNPVRRVERLPIEDDLPLPTLAQIQRLLLHAGPEPLPTIVKVALLAGLRHGEIMAWRWRDIDLGASPPRATVRASYTTTPKGGRARTNPLHPALVDALTTWRSQAPTPGDDDLVFPVQPAKGRRAGRWVMAAETDQRGLPALFEAAGFPMPVTKGAARRRCYHLLRHVFLSRCRDCGVPADVISDLAGHSNKGGAQMTQAYLHDTPERLQRIATELGRLWYLPAAQHPPAAAPPAPAATPPADHKAADVIDLAAARAARTRRAG